MWKICYKLTIKIPERRKRRRCGLFIVNFEQISNIILVFPLSILHKETPAGKSNKMEI